MRRDLGTVASSWNNNNFVNHDYMHVDIKERERERDDMPLFETFNAAAEQAQQKLSVPFVERARLDPGTFPGGAAVGRRRPLSFLLPATAASLFFIRWMQRLMMMLQLNFTSAACGC